jgi:hypothetical protein
MVAEVVEASGMAESESRIHDSRYHGLFNVSIMIIVLVFGEWTHLFE